MIDISFKFIAETINRYLNLKLDTTHKNPVVVGDITKASDIQGLDGKIVMSLINIEEDKVLRNSENFVKIDNKVIYRNPGVNLNLYCMFAVNMKDNYETVLKELSLLIQFFQFNNVFTREKFPPLDPRIDKLIFDLYTMNFEQLNHVWGILGGKYFPSVIYKMRLLTFEAGLTDAESEPIKIVELEGKDFTH